MDNQSFNERHSLTGNSGLMGMTSLRTKLQPVRVKQLLEMFGSDEEDSEERGKDSDDESVGDDIQPLPDDDAEVCDANCQSSKESNKLCDDNETIAPSHTTVEPNVRQTSEERNNPQENSPIKQEKHSRSSDNSHLASNFLSDDLSHMKLENHRSESLPTELGSSGYFAGSSAPKSSMESNRASNSSFKPPDVPYSSSNKCSYSLVSSKSESMMQSNHSTVKSKFEPQESNFFSNERHSHQNNVSQQAESSATSAPNVQNASYLITDTPHKNNPPIGSMRPTPSVSHRSMFQTPQSSKLHQDYSKNHAQTPATIFSNWSQRHMAQTPMQSRSTILPCDSGRAQISSNIVTQHASSTAITGSSHEIPFHAEKKVRRPLAETMQSSINHKRHSQSEKSSNPQYSADSSLAGSSKNRDNSPPENSHSHSVRNNIKEESSNKSVHQTLHESKENRHPTPPIDRSSVKDEEKGKKDNLDGIKEPKRLSVNDNVSHENRSDGARHRIEKSDQSNSRNPRTSNSASTKQNTPSDNLIEKNVAPKQQANVHLSIPSSIRRANPGETMNIKGKEYLILGGLGQGMSCHVLRVQDLTNLELRAIKVVNLSRMEKENVQGCIQEISMLHKLQAPCVVRMFDYEIKYPMVHVVLEMGDTDFKSLLSSMTETKRLPLTMILYYWTEMLTAVKHIHENGVIHSDLKPANFLLVRGRLKLIDFGIASSISADMTSVVKNSPIGTLNYISPEALVDIGGGGSDSPNHNVKYKITFKSDVWSLGCILYSLIYGYTPFNNFRTPWAKMQAITNPNPKISFALPPGNDVEPPPAILIDVLRKCLQHDPKARPTVTQLLQIPYITTKPNPQAPLREIPSNIVLKIRHSLTDDEWRQFKEIMEQRRNDS